jgi:glycosyltransferase involved in cell wall biosynthesis
MVTTFYPPYSFGGDGIYIQRLSRALAARGHHIEVIHDTDGYRSMTGKTPIEAPSDDGITVHKIGARLPMLASLGVQQLGRPVAHKAELTRLLTDRFDVINYHNISLIGGPGIWPIGTGVKLHTAHEHWLVCPSHILWRNNQEICDEKRCIRCQLAHKKPPQSWRAGNMIERLAPNVDRFLMLSQSSADNHKRFGFPAPMTVFPSFLPKSETAATPPPENAPPYFLFVGRLEVIKGLQDVIPAFGPDMPAELWIAGDGNYEPELKRLAAGNPKVKFLGKLPMNELPGLYAGAIAALTPSRCYEVFPMVVLEAFREATPIVARALGPYPEIVDSTGGGLLFTDDASLRVSLMRMATEHGLREATGSAGSAAFEERWSEDVVLAQYFETVAEIADSKGQHDLAARAQRAA